jgi:hypothetical protein
MNFIVMKFNFFDSIRWRKMALPVPAAPTQR